MAGFTGTRQQSQSPGADPQLSRTADYAADAVESPPVRLGGARSTVDVPMLKDAN